MRALGSAEAFLWRTAGQQHGGDGSGLTHAGGDHVGLDELHGVVNGETRSDGAARGVDVNLNVFFGIFGLQEQHLRGGQVGDVIVNRCTDKDDVFFEQPRVNIVSALAPAWSARPP